MEDFEELRRRRDLQVLHIALLLRNDCVEAADERVLVAARTFGICWRNVAGRVMRSLEASGLDKTPEIRSWIARMKERGVNAPL